MKGIRRSLNKEKIGAPTPTFSSLPSTFQLAPLPISKPSTITQAPAPPKKVIRAIESFSDAREGELNFVEGDFFHVVGEEESDWVEASNPMTGVRGLVNLEKFTILGRNVRENGSSNKGKGVRVTSPSQSSNGPPFTSSSNNSQHSLRSSQTSPSNSFPPSQIPSQVIAQPTPPPTPKAAPLYGIVQYDFTAERPDELSAVRGEPIIVIAQSNHEWFVAKPIGRLGGPGLIPVAFVEILDVITGKKIENIGELIGDGRVPRVEEWKKMTADYKSSSIPLGRFEFDQGANLAPHSNSPHLDNSLSPNLSLASDEGRSEERYSYTHERSYYGLITSATVESFHQEEGSFWFHLRASFSTGTSLVLYRLYQDFYDFQIALMDSFPIEAGRNPNVPRTLPMMPGPTDIENETVCAQRVGDLSKYLKELCELGREVRSDGLMYEFFCLRAGDVEVVRGNGEEEDGIEGQYGELVQYLDSMDGGNEREEGGLEKGMRELEVDERYSNYSDGAYQNGQGSYHFLRKRKLLISKCRTNKVCFAFVSGYLSSSNTHYITTSPLTNTVISSIPIGSCSTFY